MNNKCFFARCWAAPLTDDARAQHQTPSTCGTLVDESDLSEEDYCTSRFEAVSLLEGTVGATDRPPHGGANHADYDGVEAY